MNDFKVLAIKTGRVYMSPDISEKFFKKMPPLIGKELEQAFKKKYPGNLAGVLPRIHFSYQYLEEMCKKAALQRRMKDLSFCAKIPRVTTREKRRGMDYEKLEDMTENRIPHT